MSLTNSEPEKDNMDDSMLAEASKLLNIQNRRRILTRHVRGSSMRTSEGSFSYADGDFIFIDPCKPAAHGSRVLARLEDGQELFRRLDVVDGARYMTALNPDHIPRVVLLADECEILGVCVGKLSSE